MKNKIFCRALISASIMIALFSVMIAGCNFKFGDPSLLTEPSVDYSASILTISFPRQSKTTKYVNIYRQDLTDDDEDSAEVMSIGLIFPENYSAGGNNFIFQDELVNAGHTYRYRVRYCEKSGYYYSEWSNKIKATTTKYEESDVLTYSARGVYFSYDESDFSLKINGNITTPTAIDNFVTDYQPCIVVSANDTTKTFMLSTSVIEGLKSDQTDGVTIPLKGILSTDFFDFNVKIEGIVGQKTEYTDDHLTVQAPTLGSNSGTENQQDDDDDDDDKTIERITWTELVRIRVDGKGIKDNTITLTSAAASDAFDFSKKARAF